MQTVGSVMQTMLPSLAAETPTYSKTAAQGFGGRPNVVSHSKGKRRNLISPTRSFGAVLIE